MATHTPAPKRPRVLLGPVEISGYYGRIATGLRQLGLRADFLGLESHPFGYKTTSLDGIFVRFAVAVQNRAGRARSEGRPSRLWLCLVALTRVALLLWLVPRYDVFIFAFGTTLLRGYDLPVLRLFRKRSIVVFNGSDSRPPYLDGYWMAESHSLSIEECARRTRQIKRAVTRIDRWADVVVDNPMSGHFHERDFVVFQALGLPPAEVETPESPDASETVSGLPRILHVASDIDVKGTLRIRDSIASLRAAGVGLDYIELERVPHEIVIRELSRCDIVVDQLYSDTPVAGFAAEACAQGKPVIVGSYLWDQMHASLDGVALPPVYEIHPSALEVGLRDLIADSKRRYQLGEQARRFVAEEWTAKAVATRYLDLCVRDPDRNMLYDPTHIRNVTGGGMTADRSKDIGAAILGLAGVGAFCLDDKPDLRAAIVSNIRGKTSQPFDGIRNGLER